MPTHCRNGGRRSSSRRAPPLNRTVILPAPFAECARTALSSLGAHRLRSALTTLGVVIGVASIVGVIALLHGLQKTIAAQFVDLGGASLTISAFTPLEDALQNRPARLSPDDLTLIATRVDGIRHITPLVLTHDEVRYRGQSTVTQIRGTTHTYQDVYDSFPSQGRFLSPADDGKRRRVCIIGEKTRESLGMSDDPTGKFIELAGEWCQVVGKMERKGELFGQSRDDHLLLPYHTARSMAGPQNPPDLVIHLTISDPARRSVVAERIRNLLRHARNLGPETKTISGFRRQRKSPTPSTRWPPPSRPSLPGWLASPCS